MDDLRTLVREKMERAGSPSYSFDDLGRRRDRKRRNQRIAAGVVGIAVFVAAVWIVTSVGSLDRSETPAARDRPRLDRRCRTASLPAARRTDRRSRRHTRDSPPSRPVT